MTIPPAFTRGPEPANPAMKGRIKWYGAMASLIYATTLAVISIGVGISLMTLGDTTSSQCERSNRHIMEGVGK